jgi:citrate lyase subunit gamma (acyl carrier protein)
VLEVEITRAAKAGTMESNDIYIMVEPNGNKGVELQLESIVMKQFGKQIEEVIMETLRSLEVNNIAIVAKDRGALDYTIRARVETAIKRAI